MAMSKQFFYPPFSRLIRIVVEHSEKDIAFAAAEVLAQNLEKDFPYLVRPAAPVVNRIRNKYLVEILIKLQKDAVQLQAQKKVIRNHIDLVKAEKKFRSVTFIADVDPL